MRPSRQLTVASALAHVLAIIAIGLAQLSWAMTVGLWILMAVSWRNLHSDLCKPRVSEVVLQTDDRCLLLLDDGGEVEAQLLRGAYVQPWLTVLNFVSELGERYAVLMTADNVDPTSFRQLRVRLRFGKYAASPSTSDSFK